jgi:hypothetical protein
LALRQRERPDHAARVLPKPHDPQKQGARNHHVKGPNGLRWHDSR